MICGASSSRPRLGVPCGVVMTFLEEPRQAGCRLAEDGLTGSAPTARCRCARPHRIRTARRSGCFEPLVRLAIRLPAAAVRRQQSAHAVGAEPRDRSSARRQPACRGSSRTDSNGRTGRAPGAWPWSGQCAADHRSALGPGSIKFVGCDPCGEPGLSAVAQRRDPSRWLMVERARPVISETASSPPLPLPAPPRRRIPGDRVH